MKIWILLVLVFAFGLVSASDYLMLNDSLDIPKCADIDSASLIVTGSDVSQNLNVTSSGGSSYWSLESFHNQTEFGQKKTIYNRRISSLGFSFFTYSPADSSGNFTYRIRNLENKSLVWEQNIGIANSTPFVGLNFSFRMVDVSDSPLLNGDYIFSVARDDVSSGTTRVYLGYDAASSDIVVGEKLYYMWDGEWLSDSGDDLAYNIVFVESPKPSSPYINFDDFQIWNYTGVLDGDYETDDFSSILRSAVFNCNVSDYEMCNFPLTFYSNASGSVSYVSSIGYPSCVPVGYVPENERIPSFEDVFNLVLGGGSFNEVVIAYNPQIFPLLNRYIERVFDSNLDGFLNDFGMLFQLTFRYFARQPASMVSGGGYENV